MDWSPSWYILLRLCDLGARRAVSAPHRPVDILHVLVFLTTLPFLQRALLCRKV